MIPPTSQVRLGNLSRTPEVLCEHRPHTQDPWRRWPAGARRLQDPCCAATMFRTGLRSSEKIMFRNIAREWRAHSGTVSSASAVGLAQEVATALPLPALIGELHDRRKVFFSIKGSPSCIFRVTMVRAYNRLHFLRKSSAQSTVLSWLASLSNRVLAGTQYADSGVTKT